MTEAYHAHVQALDYFGRQFDKDIRVGALKLVFKRYKRLPTHMRPGCRVVVYEKQQVDPKALWPTIQDWPPHYPFVVLMQEGTIRKDGVGVWATVQRKPHPNYSPIVLFKEALPAISYACRLERHG